VGRERFKWDDAHNAREKAEVSLEPEKPAPDGEGRKEKS